MQKFYRGLRLRRSKEVRDLVAENQLLPTDLIQPYFIVEGKGQRQSIASMPGIDRVSVDLLKGEIKSLIESGVNQVILFGVPDVQRKNATGSYAYAAGNVVEAAIHEIKNSFPSLVVITDVCLCAYTDHGHCGHLKKNGEINNDATLESLAKTALSYAKAGADIVAPSDMMDGRVLAIREALDAHDMQTIPILSYAAKYASAFYGPFRDAAQSAPKQGDRKSYQMDPRNGLEALREVAADIKEGADMVMVKPALSYLDVIHAVSKKFPVPVYAYSVSGEYSMIKTMAKLGFGDEKALALETLISMKRAGAKKIITYFAKDVQSWMG